MKNLNVVIVGGGAGLGALLAQMLVVEGVSGVGVIDIDVRAADAALDSARQARVLATSVGVDISNGSDAHAAFDAVASVLGRVDTLINSAAIYQRQPMLEILDVHWDASLGVNVKGTYHMMVAAAKHMRQQEPRGSVRGRIVNITSADAFKAHPQNAHYAATKAAVASLTRSFAHALAPDAVLVNSVAPAGMATEKARQSECLQELAMTNPLGRGAEPREIAEWVLMAGGSHNTYMTGENIIVSGGYIYA